MSIPYWAVTAMGLIIVAGGSGSMPDSGRAAPMAKGVLQDTAGKEVGTIEAETVYDGLRIIIKVHDVTGGDLGVHVHAGESCGSGAGAEPFAAAGPHFDPLNRGIHAGLNGPGHAGDLGNISIAADGKGKLDVVSKDLTITPGKENVIGKPIVLHVHSENLTDKPENGGSGGRLACGVLGGT
jgi:Cu-Zn family superoxide dismutase